MKVVLKATFCSLVLLALGSCSGLSKKVPQSPNYDESCNPSNTYYYELAASTRNLAAAGVIPADPDEALARAKAEIAARGVDIQPKAKGYEEWSKTTTAFPSTIFVEENFESKSTKAKAAILDHEIVHLEEYETLTVPVMLLMYTVAEGRWALEVQAYRQGFRDLRLFGVPEDVIQAQMLPTAESLYEEYELHSMPRKCAIDKAVEIWMLDASL